MKTGSQHYRTIWISPDDPKIIQIIDQTRLPHEFIIEDLKTVADAAGAIKEMKVRGAGLIGATAGYGMYLAALESAHSTSFDDYIES
ncbi:MAG: S-methyl-5-thioribose-1-phosphate isomerase, partial [Patescibacteria group bacterium]